MDGPLTYNYNGKCSTPESAINQLRSQLQDDEELFSIIVRGDSNYYIAPYLPDVEEFKRFVLQIQEARILPLRYFALKKDEAVKFGIPESLFSRTSLEDFKAKMKQRLEERKS